MEKMKIKSISIISNKNNRINSKWHYKELKKFNDDLFTFDDLCSFISWINNQDYRNHYDITVWQGSNPVIRTRLEGSIEKVISTIYNYMSFINFKPNSMTLSELHNDPNIRYLIGQYYGINNNNNNNNIMEEC